MIIFNRYKIKNINRFRTFIFTSVLIGSMFIFLILSSFTQAFSSSNIIYENIYVNSGDTLWGIASAHSNGTRIEELVYQIREINDLGTNHIYPGDIIKVPINN